LPCFNAHLPFITSIESPPTSSEQRDYPSSCSSTTIGTEKKRKEKKGKERKEPSVKQKKKRKKERKKKSGSKARNEPPTFWEGPKRTRRKAQLGVFSSPAQPFNTPLILCI
jgi:hypothetical protein